MENYLFKFIPQKEFVDSFRKGEIRLMSAYYYATLEEKENAGFYNNRFDATEGKSFILNRDNSEKETIINFSNKTKLEIGPGVDRLLLNSSDMSAQLKISCYYALQNKDIPDGKFSNVLQTMKDSLGDYFVIFLDPEEFVQRVQNKIKSLKEQGIVKGFGMDYVEYYDAERLSGVTGPFQKPDKLKWQHEYRLLVETCNQLDPFFLNIGDIRDITAWGRKVDLHNGYIVDKKTIYIPNLQK